MVSQSAYEFFANFDRTLIGARGEQFVIGQANPVPLCSLSARTLTQVQHRNTDYNQNFIELRVYNSTALFLVGHQILYKSEYLWWIEM